MASSTFLDKFPFRVRGQDYPFLRRKGLEYLQDLGGSRWTDHNLHDPGITCLESLCYTLTELGYRSASPIEDILAEKRLRKGDSPLLSARAALPGHPVTLLDYRKLLRDVPGVQNGWLVPVDRPGPFLYLDCKNKTLSYESAPPPPATDPHVPIPLRGMWDILLELERDSELGDLNLLRLPFALDPAAREGSVQARKVVLHFPPVWGKFLSAGLVPADIASYHCPGLKSEPLEPFYSGSLFIHSSDGRVLDLGFRLVPPVEKTEALRTALERRMNGILPDIIAFLAPRVLRALEIAGDVMRRLLGNRTLCEDFRGVAPVEAEEVGICADIEVRSDAQLEKVSAAIQAALGDFFAPPIRFHTLDEMTAAGIAMEDIFAGPALKHGFLKDSDMEAAFLRTTVRGSDLIQIIMNVPGVTAVKNLLMANSFAGDPPVKPDGWSLVIKNGRASRFSPEDSKFVFYKGLVPYRASTQGTEEALAELRAMDPHARLAPGDWDRSYPQGKAKGLGIYRSLQKDFPLVYGIGEAGISGRSTPLRKAQAKQLKAYLLCFEQLMADHLAQLTRSADLFSLDPEIRKTYFSQPLYALPVTYRLTGKAIKRLEGEGVPAAAIAALKPLSKSASQSRGMFEPRVKAALGAGHPEWTAKHLEAVLAASELPGATGAGVPRLFNLLKGFVDTLELPKHSTTNPDDRDALRQDWDRWIVAAQKAFADGFNVREPLLEDERTFEDRRNRFLDHLLARYNEQFTEYVALINDRENTRAPALLIGDKLRFLRDYPVLGAERGKAHDYSRRDAAWDTGNVSGLEKRVTRLMGIPAFDRVKLSEGDLHTFEIKPEKDADPTDEFRFNLTGGDGKVLLSSTSRYASREHALGEVERVLWYGTERRYYRPEKTKGKTNGAAERWFFNLVDETGDVIARRIDYYSTRIRLETAMDETVRGVREVSTRAEGVHFLEHILLRPRKKGQRNLTVCTEGDCGHCQGEADPYSFRATAVVPAWTYRFRDMDFRRLFEDTLRAEAPAHVHVKICWVDREDMAVFEKAYQDWLEALAAGPAGEKDLEAFRDALLTAMENQRSVYPESRLHDCDREDGTHVLLNFSKLGSTKVDPHDD